MTIEINQTTDSLTPAEVAQMEELFERGITDGLTIEVPLVGLVAVLACHPLISQETGTCLLPELFPKVDPFLEAFEAELERKATSL